MEPVAQKIFQSRIVEDSSGEQHPLHSETSKEQCEQLQSFIKKLKPVVSLEIGLAFGISSLFICEALKEVSASKHIIIDPFQNTEWKGIGLNNLEKAGYTDILEFYEDYSDVVLPKLLESKVSIDFAYVDTTKLFDVVLVDAYFLTKLMNVGGLLFIDDCGGPGIRKVCRFLAQHPSWEVIANIGVHPQNHKKKLVNKLTKFIPKTENLFSSDIVKLDSELGVSAHCIGFKKIKNDDRHWSWHTSF